MKRDTFRFLVPVIIDLIPAAVKYRPFLVAASAVAGVLFGESFQPFFSEVCSDA